MLTLIFRREVEKKNDTGTTCRWKMRWNKTRQVRKKTKQSLRQSTNPILKWANRFIRRTSISFNVLFIQNISNATWNISINNMPWNHSFFSTFSIFQRHKSKIDDFSKPTFFLLAFNKISDLFSILFLFFFQIKLHSQWALGKAKSRTKIDKLNWVLCEFI